MNISTQNTTQNNKKNDEKKTFTTAIGKRVEKTTTKELAKMLLENPGTIFNFSTRLNDARGEVCGYYITCVNIFYIQTILINKVTIGGGAPFMFDIMNYDVHNEEMLDKKCCINTVVDGLHRFKSAYGYENAINTWYIDTESHDFTLRTSYTGILY